MLIAAVTRDELLILGILFALVKVLVIGGLTLVFIALFLAHWGEAMGGRSLVAFSLVFGAISYLGVCGLYSIMVGWYRPSPFILVVFFLLSIGFTFNRFISLVINPLLNATLLAVPLTLMGVSIMAGLYLVYTTGSLFGHLTNLVLACAFMSVIGAVRNYLMGR